MLMRHTATILIGQDLKPLTARLGKYILKYGEADASSYFTSMTWLHEVGGITEIKKAIRDDNTSKGFVSTMQDVYNTKLEEVKTLTGADRALDIRHFFTDLHRSTVTIDNAGDSNSLLAAFYIPLYNREACEEAISMIEATTDIQSNYTIMIVGLCESLGHIISPEEFRDITAEEEINKKRIQKEMVQKFAEMRLQQNTLEQIVVLQNTNSDGFALNLDLDSLLRIMGELALICVEKYNTIFTQAGSFDREHPISTIGLSVMNLDKYYFENYLLRRAYLRIMEREDVTAEEVNLNKVAVIANNCLAKHKSFFSNFYGDVITPLWRKKMSQNDIVAQTAEPMRAKLEEVGNDLIAYIQDPQYTLPEKQGILAMIMGYDDPLLKGNLFTEQQLTLDNLDEEVANCFIEANNACVKTVIRPESDEVVIEKGPLDICTDEDGKVTLPIEKLQKLRNEIRQSTNYIREKNKELEEIEEMTQDAVESEKRLTENGFIVDGTVYLLDVKHEEVKFDETYVPKNNNIEESIDLRENFTKIKDQGKIGACTVFSIASIYEYLLKKNAQKDIDLSESFVYYNVRHADGKETEDTGSSYHDVITSIGEKGICKEILHPYSHALSDMPSAEAYLDGESRRITKALNVNISETDIKSAIQEGYPVAVSLKIYSSFNSTTGFVERPTEEEVKSADYGYHAMVVVGYTDETKHFVVRNSWGEHFGDEGYCYIPYSYISDPNLNRMACIVTEVDYSEEKGIVVGGGTGKKQIVQFNMNDARIKTQVIKNLLEEEQLNLKKKKEEDSKQRLEYEKLMQALGRQPIRNMILERYMGVLSNKIAELTKKKNNINESERPQKLRAFDSNSWKVRFIMMGIMGFLILIWIIVTSIYANYFDVADWLQNEWCYLIIGLFGFVGFILVMYWWYIKNQRRRLEMELEEMSAQLSERIHQIEKQKEEQKMKMHVAGMIIDDLLKIKVSLNKKYQAMKAYVGNLCIWYDEEQKSFDAMEPLVKNPFIPLLSNKKLYNYFEENKNEITKDMHLYEYFKGFKLDEDAIIAYKRQLKQNILGHIKALLDDFTIFRHIFATRDYPFLDNEYASSQNLLPALDSKSVPFGQVQRTALTKPDAHFLFIHTDAEEEQAWKATYPKYFKITPISENISSVFKIIGLRLQVLLPEEIILD